MRGVGDESGIPFGNYTLLRRIARGGMAEVFVARQKGIDGFDRLVAIKRILPHLLDDKSFVGMFQEEARLAARLSHPNIVHIYDFGKVEEHFFIAMEFMHGVHTGDLIRRAEKQLMPMALAARIGADACAGLHYAHNRRNERGTSLKLVHRDISPPNLLVSYDGVVKIVDFGIAKAVSSIEQTRPGVVKGKYAYMSPEQTMGQALDGRSDVFSLGIVLWELISGKPAVTRTDQVLAMKTIRDGKVGAVEDARLGVPPELAEALAGALHKDPKKRSDARTFGNALESFIKSSSQIATRMELGAWLSDQIPPEDIVGSEKTGFGTRQATMATSLKAQGDGMASALLSPLDALDVARDEDESRGSVVSALPGMHYADQQPTRVLAVASGKLQAGSGSDIRPLSTGNSVVIDSDIIRRADHHAETRRISPSEEFALNTDEMGALGALDYDDEDEATALGPQPGIALPVPEATTTDVVRDDEPTTMGPATEVDEIAPAPALEFVDNDQTYEDAQAVGAAMPAHASYPPPAPAILPPQALTRAESTDGSKSYLWLGIALVLGIGAIALLARMGGSDPGVATPAKTDARAASVAKVPASAVPPILVTPLLDAGLIAPENREAADGSLPDAAPIDVIDAAPKVEDRKSKHRRRPPRVAKGRLAVKTSPYSVVYLQGKKLGTTPMANVPLAPGRYRLVFKNPDFGSVSKTAIIRSGKTTKLDFALER